MHWKTPFVIVNVYIFLSYDQALTSIQAPAEGNGGSGVIGPDSQVDGSLQGQGFSRAADVFVPELRSGTARPAGGGATGRNNRHLWS